MAFRKRTSAALDKAEERSASLKGIAVPLELGGSLTLVNYDAKIAGGQRQTRRVQHAALPGRSDQR